MSSSDTSRAAAASLDVTDLVGLRALVYDHIRRLGLHGATCDEVEQALKLRH